MGVVIEVAGWAGSIIILVGYGLFSSGRIGQGRFYQSTNLIGALLVLVNVAAHGAVPSTVVNGVWAAIALVALGRIMLRRTGAPTLSVVEDSVPTNVIPLVTTPIHIVSQLLSTGSIATVPGYTTPLHTAPTHTAPTHAAPTHAAPTHTVPTHAAPTHTAPTHTASLSIVPASDAVDTAVNAAPDAVGGHPVSTLTAPISIVPAHESVAAAS